MKYKKNPTVVPAPTLHPVSLRFPSIVSQACGRGKRWKPAVELLKTMRKQGIVPDTVSTRVGAVCSSGRRSIGIMFHDFCSQNIDNFSIWKSNAAIESWLFVYRQHYGPPPLSPPLPSPPLPAPPWPIAFCQSAHDRVEFLLLRVTALDGR